MLARLESHMLAHAFLLIIIPHVHVQVVLMLDTLIGLRGMQVMHPHIQDSPPVPAHICSHLLRLQAMHPRTTRLMNSIYNFDASRNSEVRCSWYRLCLAAGAHHC